MAGQAEHLGCGHHDIRFIPDPDIPFRMGREVCGACGAQRLVEGDHIGPWATPNTNPTWGTQTSPSTPTERGEAK